MMSSNKEYCADEKFDHSLLSNLKCENEQTDPTCHKWLGLHNNSDEYFNLYGIKKEPAQDLQWNSDRVLAENVLLKEETNIIIEEHKPRCELMGKNSSAMFTYGPGTWYVAESEQSISSGSKSEEQAKYSCSECDYETTVERNLLVHIKRRHSRDAKIYQCTECSFQTRDRFCWTRHRRNKHSKDVAVYKCEECSFETKYENNLMQHIKHKHSKEAKVHKCDKCSYETSRKDYLTKHYKKKHLKDQEVYICQENTHETRRKDHLTQDYENVDSKDTEMYKYQEESSYESKFNSTTHQYDYNHSKGVVKVYKCQECPYETKIIKYFTRHCERQHPKGAEVWTK